MHYSIAFPTAPLPQPGRVAPCRGARGRTAKPGGGAAGQKLRLISGISTTSGRCGPQNSRQPLTLRPNLRGRQIASGTTGRRARIFVSGGSCPDAPCSIGQYRISSPKHDATAKGGGQMMGRDCPRLPASTPPAPGAAVLRRGQPGQANRPARLNAACGSPSRNSAWRINSRPISKRMMALAKPLAAPAANPRPASGQHAPAQAGATGPHHSCGATARPQPHPAPP